MPTLRGANVLVAVLLVAVTLLALILLLAYRLSPIGGPAPAPTPTFEPFVLPTASDPYIPGPARHIPSSAPTIQRRTWCPDCQSAGQPANVWTDAAMTGIACRLAWDVAVSVIEQSGGMALVSGGGCRGWIRTSLLR